MAKVKAEENFKRYRFSVPHADVSINKWVEQQSNLSMSLRMLIGESIEKSGYVDYTCRERVPGAKRGRPPKSVDSDVGEQPMEPMVQQFMSPPVPTPAPVPQPPVERVSPQSTMLSDDDIAAMFNQ